MALNSSVLPRVNSMADGMVSTRTVIPTRVSICAIPCAISTSFG